MMIRATMLATMLAVFCLAGCASSRQKAVTLAANTNQSGEAVGKTAEQLGSFTQGAENLTDEQRAFLEKVVVILAGTSRQITAQAQALLKQLNWSKQFDETPAYTVTQVIEEPDKVTKQAEDAAEDATASIDAWASTWSWLTGLVGATSVGASVLAFMNRLKKWKKVAETAVGYGRDLTIIAERFAPKTVEDVKKTWSDYQKDNRILQLITPILNELKAKEKVENLDEDTAA